MRIAFIADPKLPGGWYRGIGPMVALIKRGHEVRQLWRPDERMRAELVAGCDVLHVYRRHDDETLRIVRRAREMGIAIVYDNDDDMRAVPKGAPAHGEYSGFSGERAVREIRKIVEGCDLATSPSPVVAERLREYGASRVEVLENYVPDTVLATSAPSNGSRVVIGWVLGDEHKVDIWEMSIGETIGRLLDAYPQLEFSAIGIGVLLRRGVQLSHERYRRVSGVDFLDLPKKLAELDVGLAPMIDIPFNRARSNIKLKEYAALDRPWLASPVGPYAGLGEKQGGRLVAEDGWYDAIARLIEKPRERRKLTKRASAWGREQAISANAWRWEQLLAEAVERAAVRRRSAA